MENILQQIRQEREKQTEKWGEQNHPSLCPVLTNREGGASPERYAEDLEIPTEARGKQICEFATKAKRLNWGAIAVEEFAEVVAAHTDYERRSELVQLAAVIVQWIECLDRNNRCKEPEIEKFTDNTVMPFGKHKGIKLANVPASYLLWLKSEGLPKGPLLDYIVDNMEMLKKESGNFDQK